MSCDLSDVALSVVNAIEKPHKTVGKLSTDLIAKEPDTKSPIEQMRENLTDYDKHIWECVDRAKKDIPGDFFIEVITKREPLLQNVIRNYFGFRNSCPTPNYDHAVYRYTRSSEKLEFIWIIPDRETCHILVKHRYEVVPEEYELLDFVLRFATGQLFALCKKLNGEV